MNKTAVMFSPIFYQHDSGKDHPESAKRLQSIVNELKSKLSTNKKWEFVRPHKASIENLELIHGIEYIRLVEAICRSGGGPLDLEDTVVSRRSFDVALYAVGGALEAVDLVMKRKTENAFALVRPPGHHASKFRACGFCIFNNIAIAVEHLRRKFGLKRVLVLDIDAHHGNGTQETFYETDEVMYISLHEDPTSFPGTGFVDEIGKGEGKGYTVNIPLPLGTSDSVYLRAMNEVAMPITRQYRPEFILVSAGFDAHCMDPVGNLSLSASTYKQLYDMILKTSSETCQGKTVSILEGGYNVNYVGKLCATAIARMAQMPYSVKDKIPLTRKNVELQGLKTLRKVKNIQRKSWDLD